MTPILERSLRPVSGPERIELAHHQRHDQRRLRRDLLVGCGTTTCQASTLTINGGTITNHGQIQQEIDAEGNAGSNGTLTVAGGTLNGNPVIANNVQASLSPVAAVSLTLVGTGTLASSGIGPGETLTIGDPGVANGSYTDSEALTNNGTVDVAAASNLEVSAGVTNQSARRSVMMSDGDGRR